MNIDELPPAERERRFWEVWEARKRYGVAAASAACTDDFRELAHEWRIEVPKRRDGVPGQSAFERINGIAGFVKQVRYSHLDEGHEVLIRFVYDLRDYMGWPDNQDAWRISNDKSAGAQMWLQSFETILGPGNAVVSRGHAAKMLIAFRRDLYLAIDVEVKKASDSQEWTMMVGGVDVGNIDPSSCDRPTEALKKGAAVVAAEAYKELWR